MANFYRSLGLENCLEKKWGIHTHTHECVHKDIKKFNNLPYTYRHYWTKYNGADLSFCDQGCFLRLLFAKKVKTVEKMWLSEKLRPVSHTLVSSDSRSLPSPGAASHFCSVLGAAAFVNFTLPCLTKLFRFICNLPQHLSALKRRCLAASSNW